MSERSEFSLRWVWRRALRVSDLPRLDDRAGPGPTKAVLGWLETYMDDAGLLGGRPDEEPPRPPSLETLAADSGYSKRLVQGALAFALELGWLVRVRPEGGWTREPARGRPGETLPPSTYLAALPGNVQELRFSRGASKLLPAKNVQELRRRAQVVRATSAPPATVEKERSRKAAAADATTGDVVELERARSAAADEARESLLLAEAAELVEVGALRIIEGAGR